jgi:hypothetical protein
VTRVVIGNKRATDHGQERACGGAGCHQGWAPCACTIATSAFAQDTSTQLTLFSIKGGETLPLYRTTVVSYCCEPIFLGVDGIDILEGLSELSVKYELGMVPAASTLRDCPKPVNGVMVTMTAKDISE